MSQVHYTPKTKLVVSGTAICVLLVVAFRAVFPLVDWSQALPVLALVSAGLAFLLVRWSPTRSRPAKSK